MALADLTDWFAEFSTQKSVWYLKRLAANDTLASGAHQAGPYIPKDLLFEVFPSINRPDQENPETRFPLRIDSHPDERMVRAVWYNNKLRGGTRNESRVTNFGGQSSALLDPENTGALAVLVFLLDEAGETTECRVWVCRNRFEEELLEDRVGPVEPGQGIRWTPDSPLRPKEAEERSSCWLTPDEIPPAWLTAFPTGAEIIAKTLELRRSGNLSPDDRLLRRRDCEFELFRSVEEAVELPRITKGFTSIDDFVSRAQSILQRRKARSGRSLELHFKMILEEEGFVEGRDFSNQPESEPGKRPDFLFPSQAAYQNLDFPAERLRMLAVKTTCKDRWRQIINEADRIQTKHLLTLQEGVSENQFREMTEAGVKLVVPRSLAKTYPIKIRPKLVHLAHFSKLLKEITLT